MRPTSLNYRPRVTTPAQDIPIQLLHMRHRLRPTTRTADKAVDLHNLIISAQTVRNLLWEAHLCAQFGVVTDFGGQMLSYDGHWHAGEVCSSQMNPSFDCTGQMADNVYTSAQW